MATGDMDHSMLHVVGMVMVVGMSKRNFSTVLLAVTELRSTGLSDGDIILSVNMPFTILSSLL